MSQALAQEGLTRLRSPSEIVAVLPHAPYNRNFQPEYGNEQQLVAAIDGVQRAESPTIPVHIDHLRHMLGRIADGDEQRMIVIAGRCAEPLDAVTAEDMAHDGLTIKRSVQMAVGSRGLFILRSSNYAKPRSSEYDGQVPSFMGESINGLRVGDRTPDPGRMRRAARRAGEISRLIDDVVQDHQPLAHEMLLLPYEHAQLSIDARGKTYLTSTDLPWIGARTNAVDAPHVEMLRNVENAVGVKIGDDSTPEHIASLAAKLNPDDVPGKLVFMLRLTPGNEAGAQRILQAIQQHAPRAVVLYDIHGVTRASSGHKIRAVPEIAEQICTLAALARENGLRLHGIHVEATGDNSRYECVDTSDDLPKHPGSVDPQLRPEQLTWLLRMVAPCFDIQGERHE